MKVSNLFGALNISASGLKAQRKKLDAIAKNIANVNTTRTEEGGPYQREVVTTKATNLPKFQQVLRRTRIKLAATQPGHTSISDRRNRILASAQPAVTPEITKDNSPFKKIYDPSHPDADEEGYVLLPNVNPMVEMVDLINASRSYEANLTIIDSFKQMAREALDI
ncbi:MAG: flagellar basal body rod protein FlgC [Calditrichia bacterium]